MYIYIICIRDYIEMILLLTFTSHYVPMNSHHCQHPILVGLAAFAPSRYFRHLEVSIDFATPKSCIFRGYNRGFSTVNHPLSGDSDIYGNHYIFPLITIRNHKITIIMNHSVTIYGKPLLTYYSPCINHILTTDSSYIRY